MRGSAPAAAAAVTARGCPFGDSGDDGRVVPRWRFRRDARCFQRKSYEEARSLEFLILTAQALELGTEDAFGAFGHYFGLAARWSNVASAQESPDRRRGANEAWRKSASKLIADRTADYGARILNQSIYQRAEFGKIAGIEKCARKFELCDFI